LWVEYLEDRVAPSTTTFAVIGDYGQAGTPESQVAALVNSWNPNLILTTGDNNYPTGAASTIDANIGQYYHNYISPYLGSYGAGAATNQFFPTLGSHDWGFNYPNPTGDQPYLNYFTGLPGNRRYYTFTVGPVQFFALDSNGNEPDGTSSTSTQALWLQAQLAASTATYKIVYLYDPPYTSSSGFVSPPQQWPFQAWGATAVISGHAHNYERLLESGLPYFVDGLGGGPGSISPFDVIDPGSQVRYNANFGAMLVTASATQIQFQFIAITGAVIDTYMINAGTPMGPSVQSASIATGSVQAISVPPKTAGSQSLSATSATPTTLALAVQPAAASSPSVAGLPSPTQKGGKGRVSFSALDPNGNIAAGNSGTIQLSSSDSQTDLPANYTFPAGDSGVYCFLATLETAGSLSLTATDTATPSITGSQTLTIQAAPTSVTFAVIGDYGQAGTPESQVAALVNSWILANWQGSIGLPALRARHDATANPTAPLPIVYRAVADPDALDQYYAQLDDDADQALGDE